MLPSRIFIHQNIGICILSLVFTVFTSKDLQAQTSFSQESVIFGQNSTERIQNEKQFAQIIDRATTSNLSQSPMSEIVQTVAYQFLGASYKTGLLDQFKHETLFISLKNFDCVLFVETVLAIARSISLEDYRYTTFTNNVLDLRYQHGQLNGYCSRLHYFSSWIRDNEERGNVQNITPYLGGIYLNKKLNFMSTHRQSYSRLRGNNANYECIKEMEAKLEKVAINYIPKTRIQSISPHLKPGDIIGIATNINGLDVTHTGLVYQNQKGSIGLIHASPVGYVTIASDLNQYVNSIKNSTGIIITRPIDPH